MGDDSYSSSFGYFPSLRHAQPSGFNDSLETFSQYTSTATSVNVTTQYCRIESQEYLMNYGSSSTFTVVMDACRSTSLIQLSAEVYALASEGEFVSFISNVTDGSFDITVYNMKDSEGSVSNVYIRFHIRLRN